jgi:hypothetical protein
VAEIKVEVMFSGQTDNVDSTVLHPGYAYTVSLVSTKASCEIVCAPGKCAADSMEAMPESSLVWERYE